MKRFIAIAITILFAAGIFSAYIWKENEKTTAFYTQWEEQTVDKYKDKSENFILVDITKHKLYLFKGDKIIKEYTCASGTPKTPSPIGTFKIVSKASWGEGFGGTWMGFNVPWGKYGIHGTLEPGSVGWDSSQGCIRMRNDEVKELSKLVKIGTIVEIYGGDLGPFGQRFRTLEPGMRGADVMEVQRRMKKQGFYYGNPNGIYDAAMDAAVIRYQKKNKLKVDKKVGTRMYELLGCYAMD